MAIKHFTDAPYYDDFDASKNYLRMLFRPGHAVQARELTQLQTVLQNQVGSFADHIFRDGSKVTGPDNYFNDRYSFIKVTGASIDNNYDQFVDTIITGQTSGVTAKVLEALPATETDPVTFYVSYLGSGSDNTKTKFDYDEELINDDITPLSATMLSEADEAKGYGTKFTINDSIYYVNNAFVLCNKQSVIVDKYSEDAFARIVLKINENVVTSSDDGTLVDNATGSPNYSAPGANRYQIDLELVVEPYDIEERTVENYIPVAVIKNGVVVEEDKDVKYAEILDILAKRTYEESGNYTVNPFPLQVKDHPSDPDKMIINLEPSVAYIQGYRIETTAGTKIELDRSRNETTDVQTFQNTSSYISYGNYVTVENVSGLPRLNDFGLVNLIQTSDSNAVIGTARIRSIEKATSTTYRVYLFDIQVTESGKFKSNIEALNQTGTPNFSADLVTPGLIEDAGNNTLIVPLSYTGTKSISDITVTVNKIFSGTVATDVDTSKYVLFSPAGGESFSSAPASIISAADGTILDATVSISGVNLKASGAAVDALTEGDTVYAYAVVQKNATQKSKSLSNLVQDISSPNTTPGEFDILNVADGHVLNSITLISTGQDITSRYDFDNGQRDNFYDLARIRLKLGASAPSGPIRVDFDYFTPGTGDFFTRDSYTIDWEDIPSYTSVKGTFNLRNVLDFRPIKTSGSTTFTGVHFIAAPAPNTLATYDHEVYLGRRDKVYVKKDGTFGIAKGVPSLNPNYPADINESMTLYKLDVAPYTASVDDVRPTYVENRRYTMRDIGDMENRIRKLEYYTTLSLLEKDVMSSSTLANDGTERFKNGFVVDSFYGHNVGDVFNSDYRVSMDIKNGTLRPLYYKDAVSLQFEPTISTNVEKNGRFITLPIEDHVVMINQPYASGWENLNKYLVFKYVGNLKLDPNTDDWIDVEERPAVTVDNSGIYDAIQFIADRANVTGTFWEDWITVSSSTTVRRSGDLRTATTVTDQRRTGEEVTLSSETIRQTIDDNVVDVNIVPFIRSRRIYFYADRLKPNTKMYLFIDDVNATNYARSTTNEQTEAEFRAQELDFEVYKGNTTHPAGSNELITNSDGRIWGSFIIPSNDTDKIRTGRRVVRLIDDPNNDMAYYSTLAETTYEASGMSKTVQDLSFNSVIPTFEVSELSDDRTLTTTRSWRVTPPQPPGPDGPDWDGSDAASWDPLAQTFRCQEQGGAFITKIHTYFRTRAPAGDTNPIYCQIRNVVNGYPTSEVIGETVLYRDDINISDNGSVATEFVFDTPIFVRQDQEYAFVLKTMSIDYDAWIGEIGQFDLQGNFRITEQPAAGVMFTSANDSAWTAEQYKDVKFKLFRAKFDVSNPGNAVLSNVHIAKKLLVTDPFTTYAGSNIIRVAHKNHGMLDGGKVVFEGAVETGGINGIDVSLINGVDFTISNIEQDSYTIEVLDNGSPVNANANGSGGGATVKATEDKKADVICSNISTIISPETSMGFEFKAPIGKTIGGVGTPYVMDSQYSPFLEGNTLQLDDPIVVPGQKNVEMLSGSQVEPLVTKGLFVRSTMSSTVDNLSPVINTDKMSMILVSNKIDNPVASTDDPNYVAGFTNIVGDDPNGNPRFVAETEPKDNTAASRYMIRKVVLEEEANDLKIWLKVNRPRNTYIDVYYRIDEDDQILLEDTPWTLIEPTKAIPQTEDASRYSEVEYDEEDIGQFSAFQIKIVMRSANTAKVPTIKDFRAIALS